MASAALTSRPSGATVALSWEPRPAAAPAGLDGGAEPGRPVVAKELTEPGVGGGRLVSTRSEARSSLFPTSSMVRCGDASARAVVEEGCQRGKRPVRRDIVDEDGAGGAAVVGARDGADGSVPAVSQSWRQ